MLMHTVFHYLTQRSVKSGLYIASSAMTEWKECVPPLHLTSQVLKPDCSFPFVRRHSHTYAELFLPYFNMVASRTGFTFSHPCDSYVASPRIPYQLSIDDFSFVMDMVRI